MSTRTFYIIIIVIALIVLIIAWSMIRKSIISNRNASDKDVKIDSGGNVVISNPSGSGSSGSSGSSGGGSGSGTTIIPAQNTNPDNFSFGKVIYANESLVPSFKKKDDGTLEAFTVFNTGDKLGDYISRENNLSHGPYTGFVNILYEETYSCNLFWTCTRKVNIYVPKVKKMYAK